MGQVKGLGQLRHVTLPSVGHLGLRYCDGVDVNAVSVSCTQMQTWYMLTCGVLVGDSTQCLSQTLRRLLLCGSSHDIIPHVEQAGRWLAEHEAETTLQHIWPDAQIDLFHYEVI